MVGRILGVWRRFRSLGTIASYEYSVAEFLLQLDEDLRLSGKSVWVDISGFEGDDHRRAFLGVFEKMVQANRELIKDADTIDSPVGCFSTRQVISDSPALSGPLYDLGVEAAEIVLHKDAHFQTLVVKFDNPEFVLKS